MKISFNGVGETVATFEAAEGVAAGMPVKVTGDGAVGPCAAGDKFCGVAVSVRGGYAAVQLSGYARVPYSGTAPTAGYRTLAGAGDGAVKTDAAGRELLVGDADPVSKTCGIFL